ncbi:MAG: hypothetical protein JWN03_771 [Nocardia sp.]|uniref:hypothetical protein n=1 Tax=Nocardia sp. TaxID=1821 RepID=UPI00260F3F3A|nr:hypothetical protein [Nocardia sp.]MCU1640496.1 hypothetical protein [Nocardia sp.]
MNPVPSHPALTAAQARLAALDQQFQPVAMIEHEEGAAAVLLESRDFRVIVIVANQDGEWVAPSIVAGTPRPTSRSRPARTAEHRPLLRMSRSRVPHADANGERADTSWSAVLGTAAADATTLTVISTIDSYTAPIASNGLAFALVRTPTGEHPLIHVHTADGRILPVRS